MQRIIACALVLALVATLIPAGSAEADAGDLDRDAMNPELEFYNVNVQVSAQGLGELSAAMTATGFAQGSRTFVVDAMNPELECANRDFPTINAAVVAAVPGDTIVVCPGLYNESIQVTKPDLTIKARRGPGAWDCFDPAPADPRRDAIVVAGTSGATPFGFNILANRAHIEGFVIQGSLFGVRVSFGAPTSGHVIKDNLTQNNIEGIRFNQGALPLAAAEESRIEYNCIRLNDFHGSFAVAPKNARYEHNGFFRNGRVGGSGFEGLHLFAVGPAQGAEHVLVAHNTSVEDRMFLGVTDARDVQVLYNKALRGDGRSAIRLEALNRQVVIRHNELRGGQEGIVVSPSLAGTPPFFVGPSTDLDISNNDIRDIGGDGLRAEPNGMLNSLVAHNQIMGNGRDGIRIEATANSGNRINHNQLMTNAEHDCHDDTVGPGTAGTANLWEDNQAKTENRPGLCVK